VVGEERLALVRGRLPVGVAQEAAEVAAGAEGVAGPGDDDSTHRIVGPGPDEEFSPPVHHLDREGVFLLWPV